MKRVPPPKKPASSKVDWPRLESALGIAYPPSFEDFVKTYGGSVWFDNISPFYTTAKTDADVRSFLKRVSANLAPLEDNMYGKNFAKLDLALYPSEGGLFPFLVDYSGSLFCWGTKEADP